MLVGVVDVGPVVPRIGLALVDQNRMKPVRNLINHRGALQNLRHWFQRFGRQWAELLTCIIDLSEYISSMVLWILLILPCRSVRGGAV